MVSEAVAQQIQFWSIDKLVFYTRNPRKNDAAVDRMCSSIREYGFKIPCLARCDGEVVDGHLRLKAARKLGSWPGGDTTAIPVILCGRMDAGPGESLPPDGEPVGGVGRLG
jgi:ParB-like nuclease domain